MTAFSMISYICALIFIDLLFNADVELIILTQQIAAVLISLALSITTRMLLQNLFLSQEIQTEENKSPNTNT